MKQKFTTEKHKYLENKNVKNETMFNFKISCLMKKQLINVMMTLAIVFGLSVSAMADVGVNADGLTPTNARLVVVGSQTGFTAAESGTNDASYSWTIIEIDPNDGIEATGDDAVGRGGRFVNKDGTTENAPNDVATIYIQWLASPETDGNVYAVQSTSTTSTTDEGSCTTIRRFFVTVFNYDVDVFLANADGTLYDPSEDGQEEPWIDCNSWSNQIIANSISGTQTTTSDFDLTHNAETGGIVKTTSRYFVVRITTSGPAVALQNLNWRFRYSMPNYADADFYQIDTETRAIFGTLSGTSAITGGEDLTIADTGIDGGGNNVVFITAGGSETTTTEDFLFEVKTHNNLGEPKMVYDIRVDETNVALQQEGDDLANSDFNDGIKYHANVAGDDDQALDDGQSEIVTIHMSPAADVITIDD